MVLKDTGTCSFQEIAELRQHTTAEHAMETFCKLNLDQAPRFRGGAEICRSGSLYAFYVFSYPVNHSGKALSGGNRGAEFAELILNNNLGELWESKPKKNEVFHPEHSNVLWVWTPNKAALTSWYKERKGK